MTLVLIIGLTWLVAAVLVLGVMSAAGRSGRRADEESATTAQRLLEPTGELPRIRPAAPTPPAGPDEASARSHQAG